MRARYPDTEGFVERDGVKVSYEVFGSGEPALVFAPTDPLVHSRAWKAQVPYLARTSRVVTIDPRGELLLLDGAGHLPQPSPSSSTAPSGTSPTASGPRRGRVGPARLDQAAEPAQASALRLLAHRARPRPP